MTTYRAKVFVSKDGNRFLFPGCGYRDGSELSGAGIIVDSFMIAAVLGCEVEPDWLDIETDAEGKAELIHVPYIITSRAFAHGGVEVMLIGGPAFDAVKDEFVDA